MAADRNPKALPIAVWLLIGLMTGMAVQACAIEQEGLPAAEFSRIIREFSEEGGYFFSDNFTSNEDSYLTVVDKLHQLFRFCQQYKETSRR